MSAATELVPLIDASIMPLPEYVRCSELPDAAVLTLHRPATASVAPPLRLTRRGIQTVAVAVAILAGTLVWFAWLSAPAASRPTPAAPATVTVRSGDTLWSIAGRVAPNRDPRAEVDTLQRVNHLTGVDLAVGQILRTR
jgi:hypothetical protein